ncbi:hypothetical protein AJ79_09008 [Helicocarpus griseus UAMH5409]|uniref:Uncharacterized protein n=1 Tax=Helicocarpus griseus UAMH5409 TaxID=1447875 RepID=A0A2B7WN36_9EURO|nr:hypothetical protein AJ79_09008 [Helicocarpus griseus UAMH5409]
MALADTWQPKQAQRSSMILGLTLDGYQHQTGKVAAAGADSSGWAEQETIALVHYFCYYYC